MPRVYLPVLSSPIDRRFVLRGMAATLVAGMLGCGTDHRAADLDGDDDAPGPDGGVTDASHSSPPADAAPPMSSGFSMCGPDLCVDLAATANVALRTVGGQRIIIIGSKRYLVIRTAADAFVALSAICTHEGCTVKFAASHNDIECPCHGSTFALTGAVTHGPATLPLASYDTSFDAASDLLTITLA